MSIFKLAENILNNLDQSTQSSINSALNKSKNEEINKSSSKTSKSRKNETNRKLSDNNQLLASQSTSNLNTNSSDYYQNKSAKNSTTSLKNLWQIKSNTSNKEDELIDFLNNNDLTDLSAPLSQASSKLDLEKTDNTEEVHNEITDENVKFTIGDKSKYSETEDESNEHTLLNNKNDDEKKILKKEILSLNQEVKSLTKRIKEKDDEFQKTIRKIENFQNQISQSDRIIRELRSREEDLNESIKSKDSQLAVLRVRYDEIENELKTKKSEIDSIKFESDRILKDHSNSSVLQSQVLDTLKEKLSYLESNLEKEKEAFSIAQKEHMSLQSRLEQEKQTLVDNLHATEKKLNEERNKNNEFNSQLKNSKTTMNFLKQEFEEYKLKATKTLQAKDKLIATMKESASQNPNDPNQPNSTGLSINSIELDELKLERDSLREDLTSKNAALEVLRSELMELESQATMEIEILKDQIRNMEEKNEESKKSKEVLEQDLNNLRQQLDYAQDELYKQKTNLNNRLLERETEIEKLRSQLTTKSLGTTTEKELENRLHLLTENLIQKQTLIEALQSEKHSIFLQLERSEKRLHDYETIVASKKGSTMIRMHDNDEESATSKLPLLNESPFDHEVTKKVKRAASEIDKFSIRLGVFLKKYPIARIFVIFYMFLLHLWVVIVLFTYKPEVHDESFHASALPRQP